VLRDLRLNQLAEMRLEPLVRALLIRPHEARVPRHIGGEDRGEAADRGHGFARRSIGLTKSTSKTCSDPKVDRPVAANAVQSGQQMERPLCVAAAWRDLWRIVLRRGYPETEGNRSCCGVAAGRGSR
jgi:hypothetical protein